MASEDVIELGSSDEETQPAPKRVKTMPNAMVHIPSKLPGVTIKPTKSGNPKVNPIKNLIGKSVTVTKVKTAPIPKSIQIRPGPAAGRNVSSLQKSIIIPPNVMNSLNIMKKLNNSQVRINKVSKPATTQRNQPDNSKSLNRIRPILPAGKLLLPVISNITSMKANNKRKRNIMARKEVETVELDDEEPPAVSATTAAPSWYLRPEESNTSMEQENNAEPEPTKMIEITIEDSPIKPVLNKRTHEVGAELAITIDDSPVKSTAKETSPVGTDDENHDKTTKEPHSKKKLKYPKTAEVEEKTTIEIELEPIFPTHEQEDENTADDNVKETCLEVPVENIVEVLDSPVKQVQLEQPSTSKKPTLKPALKPVHKEPTKPQETLQASQPLESEFHPVYQEFIDLCLKLENSNDMKTIVEKKIKGYYRQVPKEYSESEEFIDMVQSKILAMRADPEKLYLYIKDIVDELNLQRKMAKAQPPVKETRVIEAEKFQYGEESEFDSKRQRQIRKLEKTLRKLHRAIQKLEEQEVDFDDDEDSVYLLTERYKERMVRVHAKFCQLTNTKMPSEPRIQIDPRPGQPAGPAKRLEKWVNKKVPIGKPLPFPDFHDVLRCVREANEEDKLCWNEADIMEEARDLFTRCGKKLQRRRQENEWRLAASRISSEGDPAEASEDLKKMLESNRQLGHKREADVFNKFADKQKQLQLEAVEIGDKEAEESPVESEDDDVIEGPTLESKEKRKERLRRLIQEKSKKNVEEKEVEPKEVSNNQSDEKVNDKSSIEDDESSIKDDESSIKNDESSIKNDESSIKNDESSMKDNESSVKVKDTSDNNEEGKEMAAAKEDNKTEETQEAIQSISDDDVDSDIDELHLLQKLHSDEVNTSTISDSDSGSPIDISDTIQSSSEKGKPSSDVISIENSSYSESETKDEENMVMDVDTTENNEGDPLKEREQTCSRKKNQENDKQNIEDMDSVVLASSDEEFPSPKVRNECVNLKDDSISIEETVVQKIENKENANSKIITGDLDNHSVESDKLEGAVSDSNCESSEGVKASNNDNIQDNSKDIVTEVKQSEISKCIERVISDQPKSSEDKNETETLLNGDQATDENDGNNEFNEIAKQLDQINESCQETHDKDKPLNTVKGHDDQETGEPMETDQSESVQESMDTEVTTDKDSVVPKNTKGDVESQQNQSFDSLDTMLEEFRTDLGMTEQVQIEPMQPTDIQT